MDDILQGGKRRYHIETAVAKDNSGNTLFRAFSRHKSGKKILRHYYAILAKGNEVPKMEFEQTVQSSALAMPYSIYEDERFELDGQLFVVMAKGVKRKKDNKTRDALMNHGYLMLLLAALIFILMVIRYFN